MAVEDNVANANFYAAIAARSPDAEKVLLRDLAGHEYSFGDMERESARMAALLRRLGLQPGDRVSVQVEKSVTNLWLYLGVLRAGLVYHPLNTAYALDEMQYFLSNAEPSLLVCDPSKLDSYGQLCAEVGTPHLMTLDANGEGSLQEQYRQSEPDVDIELRTDDDLAVLLYSSGTTGRPKGIMLTHKNLRSNAEVLVESWGFTQQDVLLHALPIYHVHGLFVGIHCVLMSGASMHWLPKLEVNKVRELLPLSTVMMGVPTYYTRLLAEASFGRADCQNMRLFVSGSAPLLEETFASFAERTGHTILERYGMSETGMNCSNPLIGERRAGTVGFPLPGVEIRVCDLQHRTVAVGQIGEIEVRGSNVFKGYWRMPEKTAQDFTEDQWFVTGDQGRIDDRGYLSIVGRSKDMVITGGLNVYPKEVELVLNELPGVQESAVFGVPHPDFGEAVVAAIVPLADAHLDEGSIKILLKDKLASFKVPKTIQVVASLPRNAMGKVQKKLLREQWNAPFS